MTAIRIGRVCVRPHARIHLAIDGRTCGAGRRAHVGYETTRTDLAPANLCRRCFTAVRVGRAQMLLTSAAGEKAERNRILLAAVVDGMKTDGQHATDRDMVAGIVAGLEAAAPVDPNQAAWDLLDAWEKTTKVAPAVQALPREQRPRTWADLRREFVETHHQPQAA